jgi:hypothetical protein
MTLRDALNGFVAGLRKSPDISVRGPEVQVTPGLNQVPIVPISIAGPNVASNNSLTVVDTLKPPSHKDIPAAWMRRFMGPGQPWVAQEYTYNDQEKESEPRSFQYVSSINSTISPRIGYGLMSFADLKAYALGVPEVALCVKLPTEELKSFIPTLVDDNDNALNIPELDWMTKNPDRKTPWPTWLSRFLFNVLVYDAPAVYKIRGHDYGVDKIDKDKRHKTLKKRATPKVLLLNKKLGGEVVPYIGWKCSCGEMNSFDRLHKTYECATCERPMSKETKATIDEDDTVEYNPVLEPIIGLRIIDGSTIFSVIDEKGEQPNPPAPAFTQVIWGVPRMFMNTYQLWYRPRFLRPDAPYGKSFIEDSFTSVQLLSQLWQYELDKYTVGTTPEMGLTVPGDWKSADQILEFEEIFNARMAGNSKERAGRIRFFPNGTETLMIKDMTFNKETYDAAANAVRIAAGIPKSEVGEAPEGMLGGKGFAEAMASSFYRMCISPLQAFVESLFNDVIKENGYEGVYFKLKFPNESIDPEKEEEKFSTRFTNGGVTRDEYREAIGMKPMGGEKGEYIITPGGEGESADPMAGFGNDAMKDPITVMKDPIEVNKIHKMEVVPESAGELPAEPPIAPTEQIEGLTEAVAIDLANRVGIVFDVNTLFTLAVFTRGLIEELEHYGTTSGDMEIIAGIVRDHLKEDPNYYDKLAVAMAKISGVDMEDDAYFGAPVTFKADVEMPHQGANDSLVVGIGGVGQQIRPAVMKPLSGEDPKLQEWIGGELYRRSEAVYLLDRELASDNVHYLVPVTWVDEINGEKCSIQHYISGRKVKRPAGEYKPDFIEQAAVLDYISGQVDRVDKNWLTHPIDDQRPILIDNDLSFPVDNENIRSSFISCMVNKELSLEILDSIYLVIGNQNLWTDLQECLNDAKAVNAAKERAILLYERKCIPGSKV